MEEPKMIQVTVEGIAIDQQNKTLVILRDPEETFCLPIWIGPAEAMAIQLELQQVKPPRPMSHDLMHNILNGLRVAVSCISIVEYRDNIFYAVITMIGANGRNYTVDARPSDAIALALRSRATIQVAEHIVHEVAVPALFCDEDYPPPHPDKDIERFVRLIEDVDLSDNSGAI